MSDKENKMSWKRSDNNIKKDFGSESPKYEGRARSNSISSSKSKKFSVSRSRSYSRSRKRDVRKKRSISRSHSRSRSISGSYQVSAERNPPNQINPNQKRPALNFLLFIKKSFQNYLINSQSLKKIEDSVGDLKMYFDEEFTIPDIPGCVLNIKSEDLKKKKEAAQQILEYQLKYAPDDDPEEPKKPYEIVSLIMVPNGLISMIIGTKGRQISNLIKESKSNIVVNQPIYKMLHRTINISGKPACVAEAIKNIYNIMEERYYEVSKVEMECRPLNVNTTQTHVKFVFSEEVVDYLNYKKASAINQIKEETGVDIKFYQDRKNRSLERKEHIASFKGTIQSVQDAIIMIVKKIKSLIKNNFEGKESYCLKMMINKVFVTKLIGAGGCMIQEIANCSKGASIKILSNPRMEKDSFISDIIVSIAGGFASIQDATCIIIEQIECFKKGGPVLKSGKNLNQNIAQQFINSIFCSASRKENEDDNCYTLKELFMSKKRSRSRSRSRSKENRSRSASKDRSKRHKKSKHEEEPMHNISTAKPAMRENYHHKNQDAYDYSGKDPSNNISYEEKGVSKISIDIIVPDYLVSLLIGKNGECIRGIMTKSGSMITFQKDYNEDSKINTVEGVLGRICNIKGNPDQNSTALQLISEMIIKLEKSLNGVRIEN